MANCSTCKRDVGCSCNLQHGQCLSCYSKSLATSDSSSTTLVRTRTVTFSDPNAEPVSGFNEIINDTSITQEEKLRRINEILEQAKTKTI